MPRILLDHSVPSPLARLLTGHQIVRAVRRGWDTLTNGELLAAAELDGFDLLITSDQNIRYQQNLLGRRLAIIEIDTNHWNTIRANAHLIVDAVARILPGGYLVVKFPIPIRRPRPPRPSVDP
jgi:hypothetical protein